MACREEAQLLFVQSDGGEICALPSVNSERRRLRTRNFIKGSSREALSPRVGDLII